MRRKWKKLLAACLTAVLLMSGLCPAVSAAGEEQRVLRVAFPESKGINEVYEDGTYGGCVYDWLQ